MSSIAERKVHFAPFSRQKKAIERLIRAGRFRNVTEFMRAAIDHYLDRVGQPTLSEQARSMADEWSSDASRRREADSLQAPSMASDEPW